MNPGIRETPYRANVAFYVLGFKTDPDAEERFFSKTNQTSTLPVLGITENAVQVLLRGSANSVAIWIDRRTLLSSALQTARVSLTEACIVGDDHLEIDAGAPLRLLELRKNQRRVEILDERFETAPGWLPKAIVGSIWTEPTRGQGPVTTHPGASVMTRGGAVFEKPNAHSRWLARAKVDAPVDVIRKIDSAWVELVGRGERVRIHGFAPSSSIQAVPRAREASSSNTDEVNDEKVVLPLEYGTCLYGRIIDSNDRGEYIASAMGISMQGVASLPHRLVRGWWHVEFNTRFGSMPALIHDEANAADWRVAKWTNCVKQ